MSERDIVALFFARDERAIAEFDRSLGALCYKIALDLTGDPGAAEEGLNDTRLRLWNVMQPEQPVSLKAHAAKIARRLALNRIEKAGAGKRNAVLVELDEIAEASAVSFEDEFVESSALSDTVNRYLAGKSKLEAAVFVRRYFSGESGREISRATGLSTSKVSRMLKQMRRELAEELRKEGFEQ